jgi:hypothetical protein
MTLFFLDLTVLSKQDTFTWTTITKAVAYHNMQKHTIGHYPKTG